MMTPEYSNECDHEMSVVDGYVACDLCGKAG